MAKKKKKKNYVQKAVYAYRKGGMLMHRLLLNFVTHCSRGKDSNRQEANFEGFDMPKSHHGTL